ncbi:unnamed protein product, partial [Laminaria digitata]
TAIAHAVSLLRESKSQVEGKQVIGVNAEWETAISVRQKVATIQIAPLHGTPFLFHLQRGPSGFTKETFPAPLKDLLADPNIIKTGVAIKTDATHIFSDYGFEVVNTVDLRSLAKSNLVAFSSRSLADITACLLGKHLPKDTVRFSRWASFPLSDAQRDNACMDAYVSVLLYETILDFKDPIASAAPATEDLVPGLMVRLCNSSHSSCLAIGELVSDS